MPKNILIFADGTGQFGGLRPDQRLSNIYKLYRATRPDPTSPISPKEQVSYYDPGLGSGETGGSYYEKLRNLLAAAFGMGIDDNVVDCYEKVIEYYEPGDRVLLFGFSRGAYTARIVANVMNLCGIPTKMPGGSNIPRHGENLRKIASDAVHYVYNHGNGKPRGQQPYLERREELGRRFRKKYSSFIPEAKEDVQGNVQPDFIGVFDTVASLGNIAVLYFTVFLASACALFFSLGVYYGWNIGAVIISGIVAFTFAFFYLRLSWKQFKYFSPDPARPLKITNPRDWLLIWRNGHRAVWRSEHYDRWLDSDVGFARHALAIDEHRKNFPRVGWAMRAEAEKNAEKEPKWLKQVWFAGCHSDVGGSYPEWESRLSDIALKWMTDELLECVPEVKINFNYLHNWPDPYGLQHKEVYAFSIGPFKRKWPVKPRIVNSKADLHPSVFERLQKDLVPVVGNMQPYRPEQLRDHEDTKKYYEGQHSS